MFVVYLIFLGTIDSQELITDQAVSCIIALFLAILSISAPTLFVQKTKKKKI